MSKLLTRGTALAVGLLLPALTLAQSGYYDDYDYNSYDYNDYYNSYDYDYDSGASAALGIGVMIVLGIVGLIGLAFFIFEIFMIVDCVKRQFDNRTMWLVILILGIFFSALGWIGSLVYYFTVKRKNLGHMGTAAHTAGGNMNPPAQPMQK
jgi:hypothetical protein